MEMAQHLNFTMPKSLEEQVWEQINNSTQKRVTTIFQKYIIEEILVGSTRSMPRNA